MADVDKIWASYNRVRQELCDLGLLYNGEYLDVIDLKISKIPSLGEAGYFFDSGVSWPRRLAGYKEGVIYIPRNLPHNLYVPGGTLTDTLRHEFAHAWAWLDRKFIDEQWFSRAFKGSYGDTCDFGEEAYELFFRFDNEFKKSSYYSNFVSSYAMLRPSEDFAETFAFYIRYRNSLNRFTKRKGVYRKLKAVHNAIINKSDALGL